MEAHAEKLDDVGVADVTQDAELVDDAAHLRPGAIEALHGDGAAAVCALDDEAKATFRSAQVRA